MGHRWTRESIDKELLDIDAGRVGYGTAKDRNTSARNFLDEVVTVLLAQRDTAEQTAEGLAKLHPDPAARVAAGNVDVARAYALGYIRGAAGDALDSHRCGLLDTDGLVDALRRILAVAESTKDGA